MSVNLTIISLFPNTKLHPTYILKRPAVKPFMIFIGRLDRNHSL